MHLQAEAESCFSTKLVLKMDELPIGKIETRWFGETLDIYLLERHHLAFRKFGWLSSEFELVDLDSDQILGKAGRKGWFTSTWELDLGIGEVQMAKASWLGMGYEIRADQEVLARVNRRDWCSRGWSVDGSPGLDKMDLLLIGLVFQVIQRRQASQNSASTSGS